ncbi:MAG: hypothetical protein AAF570_04780, partial [Bacteroidota bacterium]
GEVRDLQYTKYATRILLHYTDEDDRGPRRRYDGYNYDYNTRSYKERYTHFDNMSNYWMIYYILFRNSRRYSHWRDDAEWRCTGDYKPGDPKPDLREDAFPGLWNNAPDDLAELLRHSRCRQVVEFAVRAFRTNSKRQAHIDTELIVSLLTRPYEIANEFGLELARELPTGETPDGALLMALLNCQLEEAVSLGLEWINAHRTHYLSQPDFVLDLLLSKQPVIRTWATNHLHPGTMPLEVAGPVMEKVLAHVSGLSAADETAEAHNADVHELGKVVLSVFAPLVPKLPGRFLEPLLSHGLSEVMLFGGKLLLQNEKAVDMLDNAVFERYIRHALPEVRSMGMALFGLLPVEALKERKDIVGSLCVSEHAEVREQVGPILAKLTAADPAFAKGLIELFVPAMWRKERTEGVHKTMLELMRTSLKDFLGEIPEKWIWKLVHCDYRPGQELGADLLMTRVDWAQVPVADIVKLGSHEIIVLREAVWKYYEANVGRMKYERDAALRLLDASWDDSRDFALDYFRKHYTDEDWTPELLIGIVDNVKEALQAYGRELITRFFQSDHGPEYMAKLSQHPKSAVQLFVTNYLERFASGNPDKIRSLDMYFTSVLSQVNKGRVAKERVFEFLRKEALADIDIAAFVQPLIHRISATIGVRDKALCIRFLAELQAKHPQLSSGITLKDFETV